MSGEREREKYDSTYLKSTSGAYHLLKNHTTEKLKQCSDSKNNVLRIFLSAELGAGTGLCGLTALKCGAAWTTFSDLHDELIVESLNDSCRKNDVTTFNFIASDWNDVPSELLNVDFDLILAADCMFDKKGTFFLDLTIEYAIRPTSVVCEVVVHRARDLSFWVDLIYTCCSNYLVFLYIARLTVYTFGRISIVCKGLRLVEAPFHDTMPTLKFYVILPSSEQVRNYKCSSPS
ncbi:unnamed protein product [Dibothriocephalus latus]|uniref:Uncharacterized protein n=1 Tax=Dibothriocephalus latus TaxID=60516 RepID=A0A3P7NKG8_DIBLA|nr:unnamed protein product [Dibothriocephalus latus]